MKKITTETTVERTIERTYPVDFVSVDVCPDEIEDFRSDAFERGDWRAIGICGEKLCQQVVLPSLQVQPLFTICSACGGIGAYELHAARPVWRRVFRWWWRDKLVLEGYLMHNDRVVKIVRLDPDQVEHARRVMS